MPPNTLDRLYATVITLSDIQREKALNYIVPKPFSAGKTHGMHTDIISPLSTHWAAVQFLALTEIPPI